MKPRIVSVLIHIYHRLLRLYPADFLDLFGSEMQTVFAEALMEAAEKSFRAVIFLFLRELRDYPSSLLREQRSNRRNHKLTDQPRVLASSSNVDGPVPWPPATGWEMAATILPFLLFGLLYTLEALNYAAGWRIISFHWYLSSYLILLIGLGVGWVKRFPRWSLGYLGMALCFSWWLAGVVTVGFTIFGHTFSPNERWGWRGWIALLVVALVATLWSRSLSPLQALAKSIWRDWSRLSFIFYGALTWLALGIASDGKSFYNQVAYLPLDVFAGALIHVIGVLFYLRLRLPLQRALVLQGAFSLPMLTGMAILLLDGREEHIGRPNHILMWLFFLTILFGLMLLPGILGIIRRATQSFRPA